MKLSIGMNSVVYLIANTIYFLSLVALSNTSDTISFVSISIETTQLNSIIEQVGIEYSPEKEILTNFQVRKLLTKDFDSAGPHEYFANLHPTNHSNLLFRLPTNKTIDDFIEFSLTKNKANLTKKLLTPDYSKVGRSCLLNTMEFILFHHQGLQTKSFSLSFMQLESLVYDNFTLKNGTQLALRDTSDKFTGKTRLTQSYLHQLALSDGYKQLNSVVFISKNVTLNQYVKERIERIYKSIDPQNETDLAVHVKNANLAVGILTDGFAEVGGDGVQQISLHDLLEEVKNELAVVNGEHSQLIRWLSKFESGKERQRIYVPFENIACKNNSDSGESILKGAFESFIEYSILYCNSLEKPFLEAFYKIQNEPETVELYTLTTADVTIVSVAIDEYQKKVDEALKEMTFFLSFDLTEHLGRPNNSCFGNRQIGGFFVYYCDKFPTLKASLRGDEELWENYVSFVKSKMNTKLNEKETKEMLETIMWDPQTLFDYTNYLKASIKGAGVQQSEPVSQEPSNTPSSSKGTTPLQRSSSDNGDSSEGLSRTAIIVIVIVGISAIILLPSGIYIYIMWRRENPDVPLVSVHHGKRSFSSVGRCSVPSVRSK